MIKCTLFISLWCKFSLLHKVSNRCSASALFFICPLEVLLFPAKSWISSACYDVCRDWKLHELFRLNLNQNCRFQILKDVYILSQKLLTSLFIFIWSKLYVLTECQGGHHGASQKNTQWSFQWNTLLLELSNVKKECSLYEEFSYFCSIFQSICYGWKLLEHVTQKQDILVLIYTRSVRTIKQLIAKKKENKTDPATSPWFRLW